jgi:hypothetical protein
LAAFPACAAALDAAKARTAATARTRFNMTGSF